MRRGEVARRRRVRPLAARRGRLHQHPALPQAARVRGRRGDPPRRPRGARRAGQRRPRPRASTSSTTSAATGSGASRGRSCSTRCPPSLKRTRAGRTGDPCSPPAARSAPAPRPPAPGPTLVLVDDSDGLALEALHGIEDVPGIEPRSSRCRRSTAAQGVGVGARGRRRPRRGCAGWRAPSRCWASARSSPAGSPTRPTRGCSCRVPSGRRWCTSPPARPGPRRADGRCASPPAPAPSSVVMEMARQAAGHGDTTHGGLVVAYAGRPAAPGPRRPQRAAARRGRRR